MWLADEIIFSADEIICSADEIIYSADETLGLADGALTPSVETWKTETLPPRDKHSSKIPQNIQGTPA